MIGYVVLVAALLFFGWCAYDCGYDSGWLAHFDESNPAVPPSPPAKAQK